MARSLSESTNELRINDNISNSLIILYYRDPTTEERLAFANESVQRKRNKVITRVPETRLKFGMMILTGFRDGDFTGEKDGKKTPMSSDPSNPNYFPDWKDQIKQNAADLVMLLSGHIFDASAETEDDNEFLPGDESAGE